MIVDMLIISSYIVTARYLCEEMNNIFIEVTV